LAPDWPCKQVLVRDIALPAVWSGPSIEGVNWRDDEEISALIAKTAVRRTSIEEAQQAIEAFTQKAGAAKKEGLLRLFAGLYERLNRERRQVIEGLERFGHKQKNLAEKIRGEAAEMGQVQGQANQEPQKAAALSEKLQWDTRVYEDRRKALSYVCESPVLIEQRLFALARMIEQNLD
jgi:hypothetical protein